MKIHEYQGKQLLARYGIQVPEGIPCFTVEEAEAAARKIIDKTGIGTVVVKAQIHAGGRGKGGGVRVVRGGPTEVRKVASEVLGMRLVTHQTGPEGRIVKRLYIEQGLDIARELYVGLVVDREARRVAVMVSTEGGMEIEQVAKDSPEKIRTVHLDPALGLLDYQARDLAFGLGIADGSPDPKKTTRQFASTLAGLAKAFAQEDCSLCEINPLIITKTGDVLALDAKVNLDDNASVRHPQWESWLDPDEEDPVELEAKAAGLSYVSLDGNIGCLVNGAGLAMATMDIIQHHGGQPANFLDVGGGATREAVTKAFQMILSSDKVQGILVNIFGGIMRCDVIAQGIVDATRSLELKVPLVVRLAGTNVEQGKAILAQSGLRISSADSMGDGARKIVAAVKAAS
jgi:succinyl-CoA synthetase beta subunit